MHHILRFYCAHQELVLRLYMFAAKFSKLPLIGKVCKNPDELVCIDPAHGLDFNFRGGKKDY